MALRWTVPLKPFRPVIVTMKAVVLLLPRATVWLEGLTVRVKSGGGGGGVTVTMTVAA